MPAPRFFCVYIGTTNDRNGNPRRGWYVHDLADPSAPATWIEEGYRGRGALHALPMAALNDPTISGWAASDWIGLNVRETGRIDVTPGEYRAARKLPRFGGAQ